MKKSILILGMTIAMALGGASMASAALDPYQPVAPSANSELNSDSGKFEDGSSLRIEDNDNKNLGYIVKGNYEKFSGVDFGADGASKVKIEAATPNNPGSIAFSLDDPKAAPFATVQYDTTGDWQKYQWFEAAVSGVSGVHDLYVTFVDGDVNIRNLQFEAAAGGGAAAPEANPKTGDSGVATYALIAAGSAAAILLSRKKFGKQA